MKQLLLGLLLASTFFLNGQNQPVNQDSLLFVKAKAEFLQFENVHGHYIQTNNVKMHYLSWGKQTGTPIVWAHGSHSNGYEFLGFADSLANLGYYVIAIDYYGHGFTPIPDKAVSVYHVADDIKFLLDDLKIEKVIIGGWSRGGTVATAFYDAYPNYVLGLILEDGGSVAWSTNDQKESIDSLAKEMEKYYTNDNTITFESEFEAINKWVENFHDPKSIFQALAAVKKNSEMTWIYNPELAELFGENSLEAFLTLVYRPFTAAKLFGASFELTYPKVIYRNLNVPMLILDPTSENDTILFDEENSKLQKEHPDLITHKIYKNTSHALKYGRPVEFLNDLIMFLTTVKNFKK